ncbi:cytochrome P450 [Mycolicibacterium madagascariense]|uniref:Cytochrome P450 n=1 Tax=Mycolicibacterium madagascariense TaxID=212765 RepID=A0A7I7XA90_9MYCO|nr:cytochrome P450 [Mycolicibacterium madagascariense]MCV7014876.1 cytochrome P450 [Mycolicibacterium madagascariense]BBZ26586.1 cytochrome P450 [Mycolicibacterium madagascariense]
MVTTDTQALPLVPRNPLSLRQLLAATREFHTGGEVLSAAGGPVTRIQFGPAWLMPPIVLVTSPEGIGDLLARNHVFGERCIVHDEVRHLAGDSLWVLPNERWVPRKRALQPVFTQHNVRRFGGHMSRAARALVDDWRAAGLQTGLDVDLDLACRRVTMQSLGRSILGLDLNERGDEIARSMHVASSYAADRALRPARTPRWLPTPRRRRARAAVATMLAVADEMLQACRADPTRDAPLVHALAAATDPETGERLSDRDICNDLLIFMLAGHDTTATALTHALWQLGRHPDVQDRLAAEVAELGDRELTPDDVPRLRYTRQVLDESLRLCPPAAGVGRLAVRDLAIGGYRVRAGSIVAVGIQAVHRDPALWRDPLAFDPDRFAADASATRSRWQFVPFAGGPRSCIGEHFALLETTLALATIVAATRIEARSDDFPVEVPYTTVAKGPIPVHVRPRTPPTPCS